MGAIRPLAACVVLVVSLAGCAGNGHGGPATAVRAEASLKLATDGTAQAAPEAVGQAGPAADGIGPGQELSLTLTAERTTVYEGEPLALQIRISNRSTRPVVVQNTWDAAPYSIFWMAVRHGDDHWQPPLSNTMIDYSGEEGAVTLGPGESLRREIPIWVALRPGTGEFRAQAVFAPRDRYGSGPWNPETEAFETRPCWGGRLESSWLTVTIKPLEKADDRAVLAQLEDYQYLSGSPRLGAGWSGPRFREREAEYQQLMLDVLKAHPASLFAPYAALAVSWADIAADDKTVPAILFEQLRNCQRQLEKMYPGSPVLDDAELTNAGFLLSLHRTWPDKGYKDEAVTRARRIIATWPDSDSADQARAILAAAEHWTCQGRDLFQDVNELRQAAASLSPARESGPRELTASDLAKGHFGPVREVVVYDYGSGKPCAIDFETATCHAIPASGGADRRELLTRWLERTGVDLVCSLGDVSVQPEWGRQPMMEPIGTSMGSLRLTAGDIVSNQLGPGAPATKLNEQARPEDAVVAWCRSDFWAIAFQTRDGRIGMLSVAEMCTWEKAGWVKLRYRLLDK